MTHVILESERIILRQFRQSDAPALGVAMRDANVTETTMFEAPARTSEEGVDRALARIAEFQDHWERHGFGIFCASHRNTDKFIGYCGLRYVEEFGPDINISAMVDRPHWSNGLASEMTRRILEYAFLDLNSEAVYVASRDFDGPTGRIFEKLGFIRQADRKLRHWPVCYYVHSRQSFLTEQIVNLKQLISNLN